MSDATPVLDAHRRGLRAEVLRALLAEEPADVLDAGAGDGSLVRLLAERGVAARGVEADAERVAAARAAGLDVAHGDARALDAEDGSADWVVLRHVLHHLDDPPAAVREAWRVARTGVLLAEPCFTTGLDEHADTARLEGLLRALDRAWGMHHAADLAPAEIVGLLRGCPGGAAATLRVEVHAPLTRLPAAELRALVARSARGRPLDAHERTLLAGLVDRAVRGALVPNGSALVIARR